MYQQALCSKRLTLVNLPLKYFPLISHSIFLSTAIAVSKVIPLTGKMESREICEVQLPGGIAPEPLTGEGRPSPSKLPPSRPRRPARSPGHSTSQLPRTYLCLKFLRPHQTQSRKRCHFRLDGGTEGEGTAYLTCPAGSCTGNHSPGRCSAHRSSKGCCSIRQSGHCRWLPCTQGCRCRCRSQSHPGTGHGGKGLGHSCRCSHHTTGQ